VAALVPRIYLVPASRSSLVLFFQGTGGFFGTIKQYVTKFFVGDESKRVPENEDDQQGRVTNDLFSDRAPHFGLLWPSLLHGLLNEISIFVVAQNEQQNSASATGYVPIPADEYQAFLDFKQRQASSPSTTIQAPAVPLFPATWVPPQTQDAVVVPTQKKLQPNYDPRKLVPVMDKSSPARRAVQTPSWSQYRDGGDWTSYFTPQPPGT